MEICKHTKARWLECEEHGKECEEIVCCDCGESMPKGDWMAI